MLQQVELLSENKVLDGEARTVGGDGLEQGGEVREQVEHAPVVLDRRR